MKLIRNKKTFGRSGLIYFITTTIVLISLLLLILIKTIIGN